MQKIAQQQNFQSKILLTEEATAKSVLDSINAHADSLESGDTFFISFSGHGTTLPASLGKKPENAWVTFDRTVGRSELRAAFSRFKKGVRIVGISDCCFSEKILPMKINFLRELLGTSELAIKAVSPAKIQAKTESKADVATGNPEHIGKLKASAIIFSSSKADATSIALPAHGLFTQKLLAIWDGGAFGGSYHDFFLAIKFAMSRVQIPTYEVRGPRDPKFEKERPFMIQAGVFK
jgi:hypothetical protein